MRSKLGVTFVLVTCATVLAAAQKPPAELAKAGWKALQDDYPKKAAALFNEGLEIAPDDPGLLLGAGAAAHALGHPKVAMARLQRVLELRPELTPASVLLGQIAFDEGDERLAIQTIEAAQKFAPKDASLAALLARWKRERDAHASFSDRRFDRFRVLFEGRADQSLAMQATSVFDSAFYRIGHALGEHPGETIVAVLYTEQQFRDITRAPAWSGGQYDGRIRIPVSGAAQHPAAFERVLVHELTHAMVATIAPRHVPSWLHEGIAQHFEGADAAQALRRVKASPRTIPLADLERGFGHLAAADARIAYDESLAAVQILADRPGFVWTRLLHRLRDGTTFRDAIGAMGLSYADFEVWRR